jgi:hypothetical protein
MTLGCVSKVLRFGETAEAGWETAPLLVWGLVGVIRGAETISHFRNRGAYDGPKPGFEGEEGKPVQAERVMLQEVLQRRYAEEGPPEVEALRPWVR